MLRETSRLSNSSSDYSVKSDVGYTTSHSCGSVIIKRHNGVALWRYWTHGAAIAVTAGLATINILNIYLMDSNTVNAIAVLNAFQFAAKLHEILIVGSLMLIMMDSVRSRLITSTGVPFGLILSPVLFNDLDWLRSHHFWSAMKPTRASMPIVALIFFSIPFANVAGPLSAITVIPRLGWSESQRAAINPSFWNASADTFWPSTFSSKSLPELCFDGAGQNPPCPGIGLQAVDVNFDPDVGGPLRCTTIGSSVACNSSMGQIGPRELNIQYDVESLTAYSSTPPPIIYERLAVRVANGFAGPINIPQAQSIDAEKVQLIELRFLGDKQIMKPATKVVCQDLTYADIYQMFQTSKIETDWSTPFAHWLGDVDGSAEPNFLYTYLKNDSVLDARQTCSGQDCFAATSCSITPRWVPFAMWHNTAQASLLFQSDPQPAKLFESSAIESAVPVTLQKDWLELFTQPLNLNISESVYNRLNDWKTPMAGAPPAVTKGTNSQAFFNPGNYSQAIAVLLSSAITEAMGRSSYLVGESIYTGNCSDTKPGFEFSPEICDKQVTDWLHATELGEVDSSFVMAAFTVRRFGYGWFFDSVTVKIALAILLLHALLTLIHVVYTIAFRGQVTTRWSSAPEMLMLAIDSLRAPVLMGSSAKARHKGLWREPVSVMEVDNGDRVSLIVGDPYSYPERLGGPPVLGKKYQ